MHTRNFDFDRSRPLWFFSFRSNLGHPLFFHRMNRLLASSFHDFQILIPREATQFQAEAFPKIRFLRQSQRIDPNLSIPRHQFSFLFMKLHSGQPTRIDFLPQGFQLPGNREFGKNSGSFHQGSSAAHRADGRMLSQRGQGHKKPF
jgi:hypothetical protein